MPKKLKTRRFFAKKFNENKKFSTSKRREIKSRDNSPLPARYQSKHKRYFYVFKKQSRLTHRRTGNRGQTCLPVRLKVIGRVCGSRKPRPRLVQASVSSLHHDWSYKDATANFSTEQVVAGQTVFLQYEASARLSFWRLLPWLYGRHTQHSLQCVSLSNMAEYHVHRIWYYLDLLYHMGVGECLFFWWLIIKTVLVARFYWFLIYSWTTCKLFSLTVDIK